jgi:hypothetical protein
MIETARAALVAAAVVAVASPALAGPTRGECIAASEDAQTKKMNGQLRSAREKLVVCSSEACPKLVKKDCSGWLDEVDRAMPTVVFGVRDGHGTDLTEVRVSMDGAPLVDHLDGKAVAVDPGQHTFAFESSGLPSREDKIVVREGEKNRIVSVTLGAAAQPTQGPQPTSEPQAPVEAPASRAPSVATWIVGGLGLATLAAAGIVGTVSLLRRSDLYNTCGAAGQCQQSDVDAVYTLYDLSYGGAALGGALVVTSIVLLFTTRPGHSTQTGLVVSPTLGGLSVAGRF